MTFFPVPCVLFLILSCCGLSASAQSCDGTLLDNIVVNGDFGSGPPTIVADDPFLAPGYQYQNTPPPDDGFYTIASTTDFGNPDFCWVSQGDNSTNPNGYLMVVNAGFEPGIFFERTLEVCDGIVYEFSVDLLNIVRSECSDAIAPNVDILIDGVVIDQTGDVPQDEIWHTYRTLLTVPDGADLLTLTLRNNAPGGAGNDLGIDNISLRHCAPNLILPTTTTACPDGVTIAAPATADAYPTPFYQWQRSFDGGTSWTDLTDENDTDLFIATPIAGVRYRVLIANGPINFLNENCRAASSSTTIELQTPTTVFLTPLICDGDTLTIGGQQLTTAGNYQIPLPGDSGCDTLLDVTLFTNPSYDQLFSQSLCSGDIFLGQEFVQDTLLTFLFQTIAGCDSIVNYEIDVLDAGESTIIGDTLICRDETTTWTGPAGFTTYQWSTGTATAELDLAQAGLYRLTVTNSQGCTDILEKELIVSDPFFDAIATPISCPDSEDGSIEVLFADGGVAPYNFQLDGGAAQTTFLFSDLATDTYQLLLTDQAACTFRETLTVGDALALGAQLNGIPNVPIETGDTLQLSVSSPIANLEYQWSGDGLASCDTCAATNWMVFPGGSLSIIITNQQGCSLTIDTLLNVVNPSRVYLPNAFSPNNDGNNDVFTLGLGSNAKAITRLEIFDRWGGAVYQYSSDLTGLPRWDGTRNGTAMPNGIYVYQAEIEFQNGRRKLLRGDLLLMR